MSDYESNISIGELAEQTGISPHTLRIWEKRYGFPKAERLPSGHRRYPRREVPRLRAVNRALEAGFRVSKIVDKNLEDLEKLLSLDRASASVPGTSGEKGQTLPAHLALLIDQWINHLDRYNDQKLTQSFHEEWQDRGPLQFILECAVPFLREIGERWERSELDVAQEHFGSERLYDFLGSMWRRLNERNTGAPLVMTTLPEETHRMGIQMCAVLVTWTGRRVVYLGPNTPVRDIAASVNPCGARQVCLSISAAADPDQALVGLHELRERLDPGINLLTGGAGAPESVSGVLRFNSIQNFYDYLKISL